MILLKTNLIFYKKITIFNIYKIILFFIKKIKLN